ncbi:MAG: hypothetical protein DMG00_30805 [Acidobacteria bacterium]|nr:MAG: hypothetical protein DMG00_30805 [Acidobacteriota bacterium]
MTASDNWLTDRLSACDGPVHGRSVTASTPRRSVPVITLAGRGGMNVAAQRWRGSSSPWRDGASPARARRSPCRSVLAVMVIRGWNQCVLDRCASMARTR